MADTDNCTLRSSWPRGQPAVTSAYGADRRKLGGAWSRHLARRRPLTARSRRHKSAISVHRPPERWRTDDRRPPWRARRVGGRRTAGGLDKVAAAAAGRSLTDWLVSAAAVWPTTTKPAGCCRLPDRTGPSTVARYDLLLSEISRDQMRLTARRLDTNSRQFPRSSPLSGSVGYSRDSLTFLVVKWPVYVLVNGYIKSSSSQSLKLASVHLFMHCLSQLFHIPSPVKRWNKKVKGKGSSHVIASLAILNSGAFTISEVADDWHRL